MADIKQESYMVMIRNHSKGREGIAIALTALTLGTVAPAQASEALDDRQITSIGCHASGSICYVMLDGANFGAG
jgi:hypothetical protein